MEFKKEFMNLTKAEIIMYLYINSCCGGKDGQVVVNRFDYEELGFKKSNFYDSRRALIEKGILRKIKKDTFFFTAIK